MIRHSLGAVLVLSLCGLAACGDDDDTGSGTTGSRIVLGTTASSPTARTKLTTSFGWEVDLTKATVAASGFYYFDGPPPTAFFQKMPTLRQRMQGLLIGTAHAHPGHYQAGNALGQAQFASPATLDLFGSPVATLSSADALTGTYRSARVVLGTGSDGHVAVAEGKAVKRDGTSTQPIYFRLVADPADIAVSVRENAVDGCVLDETVVTAGGSVNIEVKPTVWLNLVDFAKIAPGTAAAPTETKNAGFSQGVTQLSAYHFTYSK